MQSLPQEIDLGSLSIAPADVRAVSILRQTPGHSVHRIRLSGGSYVLKWFYDPDNSFELRVYALLEQVGVETLPVYGRTRQALLIEDLQNSRTWRLADPADMDQAETGRAVAKWYRSLHRAGQTALRDPGLRSSFLQTEVEQVTQPSLAEAGTVFGFQDLPVWHRAINCLEALKVKYLALPQTYNYNDFAAENLALSREEAQPRRAVVFDYDCFGTGAAVSDWRNVLGSLTGAANIAFIEAYGPVNEKDQLLDKPLATLYGLVVASQLGKFPGWAAPLIEAVTNGELEQSLGEAIEV